jgi:hypothetical protein
MIRKSHVMIASILLAATIVLSGCIEIPPGGWWPPPSPQIGVCDIKSASDFYYRNKPTPVLITGSFYNPIEDGKGSIYVELLRYDTAIRDWVNLGTIFTKQDISMIQGEIIQLSIDPWVYTRTAVVTTYLLQCMANHELYPDLGSQVVGDYMFTIWQSSGALTGQATTAFQAIRNGRAMFTRAEILITAYQAGQNEEKILQPCEHIVDLRGAKLGIMTADQAISLAQSYLDLADGKLNDADYAFNLKGPGLGDYKTAFALAKQAKADAELARKIVELTLNQIAGTECDLI